MPENTKSQIQTAINEHKALIQNLEDHHVQTISNMAAALTTCIQDGGCIYICGNGGSAADAQHIAGELVGRFQMERRALPAIALTTDTSVITAMANDYSYDDIFVRQVEALVSARDLLWAFSTSGRSANVMRAVKLAQAKGARTMAFTGRAASPLEAQCDLCLCAASPSSARSQEVHQLASHILCGLVEQNCCQPQE
jgi:D-sedoheptulose 7-phosphate isomerase